MSPKVDDGAASNVLLCSIINAKDKTDDLRFANRFVKKWRGIIGVIFFVKNDFLLLGIERT